MIKYLDFIRLVTPFVLKPFDTGTTTFLPFPLDVSIEKPKLFLKNINYSAVHNDTANL